MKSNIFRGLFLFLFLTGCAVKKPTFTLNNSSPFERQDEVVEVELNDISDFSSLALYNNSGIVIPYCVSGKSKILFQVDLNANSKERYTMKPGVPVSALTQTYVNQKMPDLRNDIAWENDLTAYRMYSKVLLPREPNTGNGVDVWYKKKSYSIIDKMYTYANYHAEQEEGVDAHSVGGKTLGAGGIVAYVNNKLWIHDPYDECTILENGPLRAEFILTYRDINIDGDLYTKTVRISSVANGLLNKAIVRLDGKAKPMKMAAGIFLHNNTQGVRFTEEANIIGYAENKSEGTVKSPDARMYAGVYMPGNVSQQVIDNQLVLLQDYQIGSELTYYFGGGWNVFPVGRYGNDTDWFDALLQFKLHAQTPITQHK